MPLYKMVPGQGWIDVSSHEDPDKRMYYGYWKSIGYNTETWEPEGFPEEDCGEMN